MIDGGFTHHVTSVSGGRPIIEENLALRGRIDEAISRLAPGRGWADVEALYIDHGHPDHTMQGTWARAARGTALTVWIGEGDRAFVEDSASLRGCGTPMAPDSLLTLLPRYVAPDYDLRTVPTALAAMSSSEWVDGGHGVRLIPAPSHTPGSLMIAMPSIRAVVASNHLCATSTPEQNDCTLDRENSACHVGCDLYADTIRAIPSGYTMLYVHPDAVTLCD